MGLFSQFLFWIVCYQYIEVHWISWSVWLYTTNIDNNHYALLKEVWKFSSLTRVWFSTPLCSFIDSLVPLVNTETPGTDGTRWIRGLLLSRCSLTHSNWIQMCDSFQQTFPCIWNSVPPTTHFLKYFSILST